MNTRTGKTTVTTITKDTHLIIFVNVLKVDPANQQELIERMRHQLLALEQ